MSIRDKIRRNKELFRFFGMSSLNRFRNGNSAVTALTMRGVGPVHLRLADSDVATFSQVFTEGEYDLARVGSPKAKVDARYRSILSEGGRPVIIDAGANVGAASLWFSIAFPKARIVAIEPNPENAALLRLNVAHREHVSVLEAAIAGERGSVAIEHNGASWATTTVRSQGGGISAVTMGDALATVSNGVPFMAKIDIEGFEADLFAGDVDWIDQMTVIFIEPHDWLFPGRRTSGAFQKAMGDRNFELFIMGENLVYIAP